MPKLEKCLLSPQHWAQEAGDGETWVINLAHCCILHWIGGHTKTVPFNKSSNTPIFYTTPSANANGSFLSTFEPMEAPFFWRETTLLMPPGHLREHVVPEEFVADEHIHRGALTKSVDTVVRKDDKTSKPPTYPWLLQRRGTLRRTRPFAMALSPLTHNHLSLRGRTLSLLLPTRKPS